MVEVIALPIGLLTVMCDRGRSNAGVKSKEESANGGKHGEAKRVQRLAHGCDVKLDLFENLIGTLFEERTASFNSSEKEPHVASSR